MSAKETVMTQEAISDAKAEAVMVWVEKMKARVIGLTARDVSEFISSDESRELVEKALIEKQATVSFKAGIKEVLEWIGTHGKEDSLECADSPPEAVLVVNWVQWQAQLQEWEKE